MYFTTINVVTRTYMRLFELNIQRSWVSKKMNVLERQW